jgi:hypothetical protein
MIIRPGSKGNHSRKNQHQDYARSNIAGNPQVVVGASRWDYFRHCCQLASGIFPDERANGG